MSNWVCWYLGCCNWIRYCISGPSKIKYFCKSKRVSISNFRPHRLLPSHQWFRPWEQMLCQDDPYIVLHTFNQRTTLCRCNGRRSWAFNLKMEFKQPTNFKSFMYVVDCFSLPHPKHWSVVVWEAPNSECRMLREMKLGCVGFNSNIPTLWNYSFDSKDNLNIQIEMLSRFIKIPMRLIILNQCVLWSTTGLA